MLNAPVHRRTPLILMTMAAFWLAGHPWRGIWHDNILYAGQALRRLYPLNFQHDLYFLHGSQDAFTIFSPVYAAAIAALGLPGATLLLLVAGYALWIAAAAYLLSDMSSGVTGQIQYVDAGFNVVGMSLNDPAEATPTAG